MTRDVTPWAVEWTDDAFQALIAMHWQSAALIDEALLRFAESGVGSVRRMFVDGAVETVLLVPPRAIVIARDRTRRIVFVRRIIRYA